MGITGVAIGTIVAMTIRTLEFIYHTDRKILEVSILKSFKKILILVIVIIIVDLVSDKLYVLENISYLNWLANAIVVFVFTSVLTFVLNYIFYNKELIKALKIVKSILLRKKK